MTTADRAALGVTVPDAPAIPGLEFRTATDADWDAMADLLNRARIADGVDEVRNGESLRAEYAPLDVFRLERDVLLAEVEGSLVALGFGYVVVREGVVVAESWGAVDPAYRRRGLGTAMWRHTTERLARAAAGHPASGPRELRSYALDIEHGDLALLAAQGYVPIRYGFEMRRFLTGPLPEHPLPEGLRLRPVTPDQHRAIFDADEEAFRDHWGHRQATEGDFVARFEAPETDTSLWCVAWDGDQVAGVVMNAIFAEENEELGVRRAWLEHVSVRRPWRGRGLAKALCAASLRVLRERGMDEAWLGVDGTNPTGALGLYEGLGFTVARRWQAFGRPLDRPAPPGWTSGSGG